MPRYVFPIVVLILAFSLLRCHRPTEAPHEVAGFALNASIAQYSSQLKTDTMYPLRHMEYLSEVETKEVDGYKAGYIDFGSCDNPDHIVAIKMKYGRSDKDFYDELLKLFKKKYGNPKEWRGDAFHTFIAWKWSFRDKDNNAISMILQHGSSEDDEFTKGNSVKLTNWTAIEKESKCYDAKHPQPSEAAEVEREQKTKLHFPQDYERFVPR